MNTLTREAVSKVARALIMLNGGKTTTLEVKQSLRKLGYWAEQADVRNFMLDITSKDGDIQYTDNGTYREYSIEADLAPIIIQPTQTPPTQSFTPNVSNYTNVSPIQPTLHRDNVKASYYVTDEFGWKRSLYLNVTRSEAKARWAKERNMPYASARTKKAS